MSSNQADNSETPADSPVDLTNVRDHFLPPDRDAFRKSGTRRIIVIAPTRAACETIERAIATDIETTLWTEHGAEVEALAGAGKGFGIVAGTGTGKTLSIRPVAQAILGEELRVGVVNREREATPETPTWNVVIVTTGIARRWFQDDLITGRDTIVADEIHQTSAELELCLALGKRVGCTFIWLSATVDPGFFRDYLESDAVIESSVFDPEFAASVRTYRQTPPGFIQSRFMRRIVDENRGVAVFLPTRADVEQLAVELGDRWPEVATAFYHGGEPIRVIRPFLDGEVEHPFLLAMTAAGQSALNIPGLDTVVINDARFTVVVHGGRRVLTRKPLGANEILQMAGRVHGRVTGGEVHILTERDLRFENLKPVPPEFQLAGDSERVALTAAALGVRLDELELPVPLDKRAYRRAVGTLDKRGIISGGTLTDYGKLVEAMPVDRPWAELLVQCDESMLPYVAVAANIDSLHRMTRDEADLRGLGVSGSDHLTAYNVFAEAVNAFGSVGRVYGLERHVFDEEMDEWARGRGVLVKAIEDAALGMASVYRTLEKPLPDRLPRGRDKVLARFANLVARVMPFDLVIDQTQANGRRTRVSRGSYCNRWGAVAGEIRYFAVRDGSTRAAIEGTNIPRKTLARYAAEDEPVVEYLPRGKGSGFVVTHARSFHGFEMDFRREPLNEPVPSSMRPAVAKALAVAVASGSTRHRNQKELANRIRLLREYQMKSLEPLQITTERIVEAIESQLVDVAAHAEFLGRRLTLVVADFVPKRVRTAVESLPDSWEIGGTRVRIEYERENGNAYATLVLGPRQAKKLRTSELPRLDRPLRFVVPRGSARPIRADSLQELKEKVNREGEPRSPRKLRHRDRGGRRGGGRGGGKGPRRR